MSLDRTKKTIFSFELLLVLYLFAGYYKTDPVLSFIPVDLTMLLGLLSVTVGGVILVRNPQRIVTRTGGVLLVFFYLFAGYAGVSLFWSPSHSYGFMKFFKTAILAGWLFTATALIIAPDPERRERLFHALLLIAVWMAGESLYIYLQFGDSEFITPYEGSDYSGVARVVSFGSLVIVYRIYRAQSEQSRIALSVLLSVLLGALFVVGARGPIIAVAIGLVTLSLGALVSRSDSVPVPWRSTGYILASTTTVTLLAAVYQVKAIRRFGVLSGFTKLLSDDGSASSASSVAETASSSGYESAVGKSAGSRLEFYETAVELWQTAPVLGHGFGSFAPLSKGVDIRHYPHNILLETSAELGLIGSLLFVGLLAYPTLRLIRAGRPRWTSHVLLCYALVVYMLANAMVSGDIPSNRALFLTLGLTALPLLDSEESDEL